MGERPATAMKQQQQPATHPRRNSLFLFFSSLLALLLLLSSCSLFSSLSFSAPPLLTSVSFRPVLLRLRPGRGNSAAIQATVGFSVQRRVSGRWPVTVLDAVIFPDQVLVFNQQRQADNVIHCLYYSKESLEPELSFAPVAVDEHESGVQIVRCPPPPRADADYSVAVREGQAPVPIRKRWDRLAYAAMVDSAADNATIVFVKGLNLRSERPADPARFECVYSSDFAHSPHRPLRSAAISAAQEVVRCPTPPVLLQWPAGLASMQVSVNVRGRAILDTIARPTGLMSEFEYLPDGLKKVNRVCVCTMLRNQARFLKEWVMYHSRIGVDRWFIYDNNSDDDLEFVLNSLTESGYRATRHVWPWIKSQEAGFSHCAMRARGSCEWVGFIDVDEFVRLPVNGALPPLLDNYSDRPNVGELRISCLNFGPSGLSELPPEGVTLGYTCRMVLAERHKSIVRPEALSPTLVNVVHHFHLKQGYEHTNVDRRDMVINHYKYQVWEVFKEKFVRRVSTYVADWQEKEKAGSKDRAPGLGTEAIEPPDWPNRFCEVNDTKLRDWVLEVLKDPVSLLLPWQQPKTSYTL